MLYAVCCMLYVVCCMLYVVCCMLYVHHPCALHDRGTAYIFVKLFIWHGIGQYVLYVVYVLYVLKCRGV
jgi:hypothetical protein